MPERKPSFSPISAFGFNFNPQNTLNIPAVKIFAVLDLDEKSWFSFGHYSKNQGDRIKVQPAYCIRCSVFKSNLFDGVLSVSIRVIRGQYKALKAVGVGSCST